MYQGIQRAKERLLTTSKKGLLIKGVDMWITFFWGKTRKMGEICKAETTSF